MSDERSLKTVADATKAYPGTKQSLSRMIHESSVVHAWLQDTREIVLEWIKAACRVKFKNETLNQLWRPLAEREPAFHEQCCRSVEAEVIGQVRQAAAILAFARLVVGDEVNEGFADRLLAAVRVLETIDATKAEFARGDLLQAFRCFETISLEAIKEPPDPYREADR